VARGSNPSGGEIFRTCPDRRWDPLSLLYNGYQVFPGGKERLGRDADPSPPSSAVVNKEQNYTSTPAMGRTVCTEPQCLYKGALYLLLYMLGLLCVGFSQGSLKGKDRLESLGTDGMISLEMVFTRSKVDGCGLGLSGSG